MSTLAVVIVHTVLTVLATLILFLVLDRAFIGLPVNIFWAVVLSAVVMGLAGYLVYLSVSHITTQRMSTLLMVFIVLGSLTTMVTTPDPKLWETHFSHLGASWGFLAALLISLALFVVRYFGLTAFEIIAFALIVGWIAVFIRFLGVVSRR